MDLHALFVQIVNVERVTDHGQRDVANRNSSRSGAAFDTVMSMSMKGDVGPALVDRFREKIAAQKGVDLFFFSEKRVLTW